MECCCHCAVAFDEPAIFQGQVVVGEGSRAQRVKPHQLPQCADDMVLVDRFST
ncbi:hypothetical protein BS78_K057200 [Paspalum vaginatum]|uniref:Uncharacterized protein n=1 Tax=Paspalum vaginatum TaxID=158149 RepID=A0A9W7XF30_9POAL|nr:hypothetical protein BS78_K057200 [Paspalum vaginatum]